MSEEREPPAPLELNELGAMVLGLDEEDPDRFRYGGNSDGFWYDMTSGGRFKWREVLTPESIAMVQGALDVLMALEELYDEFTAEF